MDSERDVTILLVEDDPGHARLIEKNLRRAAIANSIVHLRDGQEAMDFLERRDCGTREGTAPLVMLLDLSMPRLDGFQVLERLKADQRTRRIPVMVLTTTDDSGEMARCYDLGCNLFIHKPVEYVDFVDTIRQLGKFLKVLGVPDTPRC
jgi:CheY-like chemotaxis protein